MKQVEEKTKSTIKCKTNVSVFGENGVGHTDFIMPMHNCSKGINVTYPESCACELGMGGWIENDERFHLVDFLQPFVYTSFRVVVRSEDTFRTTKGPYYLSTFTPEVWLMILSLIGLFTLLKLVDKRFMPPDNNYRPLSDKEPKLKRFYHYAVKSQCLRRARKALMSTCKYPQLFRIAKSYISVPIY